MIREPFSRDIFPSPSRAPTLSTTWGVTAARPRSPLDAFFDRGKVGHGTDLLDRGFSVRVGRRGHFIRESFPEHFDPLFVDPIDRQVARFRVPFVPFAATTG